MSFTIDVRKSDRVDSRGAWKIAIRSGETSFTRLFRARDNQPDEYVVAPPTQLAFWLVDNWWRIRWECLPSAGITAEWRLAHDLSSVGGGYAWPRLAVWGEDERVGLLSRSDPPGVVGPVRYLSDAFEFVRADDFERECDEFLQNVVDEYASDAADRAALREQVSTLQKERADPVFSAWRQTEARLGFDVDEAPEQTVEALIGLAGLYGQKNVDEAATAMPGTESADVLAQEIEAARKSRVTCDFTGALAAYGQPALFRSVGQSGSVSPSADEASGLREIFLVSESLLGDSPGLKNPPWVLAEQAASALRTAVGQSQGPLRSAALADLLGTSGETFRATQPQAGTRLPYGLRLAADNAAKNQIVLRSRWPHDRRFEAARALGDFIWTGGSAMGPLAASKTARQKFQRAFAQSLLCPYDDLVAYIGTTDPTEGDVAAAARNFHVSERVVRTVLVNKHIWDRGRLSFAGNPSEESFNELMDAA